MTKFLQGRNEWLVWLIAAMTVLVMGFAGIVMAIVLWLQWDERPASSAETDIIAAETAEQLEAGLVIPTPVATPTELAAPIVVDRGESQESKPAATPTPQVTVTAAPPGSILAQRVAEPMLIDGDLQEWRNVASYASTFRVYRNANWDGSDDLDAFWRLAWDNDFLYVAALVVDDTHVQNETGRMAFRGDSLEMQIDTKRIEDLGAGLNADDFQLLLSPGDFNSRLPEAFRFRGTEQGQMLDSTGHNIQVSAIPADGGYILEASIPWNDLDVQPVDNLIIGLSLNANDNDAVGTVQQEIMKSHVSTRTFSDPTTWGTLILTGR